MSDTTIREGLRIRGLLDIARSVADDHHVTLDEILGPRRLRHVVRARYAFWLEMRRRGFSDNAIALLVGRDHKSVGDALRKATAECRGAA